VPHFSVCHQDTNLAAVLARARAFKLKIGDLRFLAIDYLQLLADIADARPADRVAEISRVTAALKRFATSENCVVILLSGFNRDYIKAGNREPKLSDLEGSGSIEKDANRVLLIEIPTEYYLAGMRHTQSITADSSAVPRFFAKVVQAKGRNQGTGTLGLHFKRETKTFVPMT
jgi:replicative DNA helicase